MNYQTQISNAHLEIIYKVLLKRIGKGYTAERLSGMIGKNHDYIERVETFAEPVYGSAELDRLALALEESNPKSFYAKEHDDMILTVICDKCHHLKKIVHIYCLLDENEEQYPIIVVKEDLFEEFDQVPQCEELLGIAKDAVRVLIRGGYFLEAKMPLEVFHAVNAFLTNAIDPIYVESALMGFSIDDDYHPLQKIQHLTKGYLYEEC